jgi:IS30 family transposase
MRAYPQLTCEERYQISILRQAGHRQTEIATMLDRHQSTVSRELHRNQGLRGYRPAQAQRLALARRREKDIRRLSSALGREVERLLGEDWSPAQISVRLKREQGAGVRHEWIYQSVYTDARSGGNLYRPRRGQKPRRKRYGLPAARAAAESAFH